MYIYTHICVCTYELCVKFTLVFEIASLWQHSRSLTLLGAFIRRSPLPWKLVVKTHVVYTRCIIYIYIYHIFQQIYIYIHMFMYIFTHTSFYIYTEREAERKLLVLLANKRSHRNLSISLAECLNIECCVIGSFVQS